MTAIDRSMHDRGGPLPTMVGVDEELPYIIQRARGMVASGQEELEIGKHLAACAARRSLRDDEVALAVAYLLKSARSSGRLEYAAERKKATSTAHGTTTAHGAAHAPPGPSASATQTPCTCGKDLGFVRYCYREDGLKGAVLAILLLPLYWPLLLMPDRHAPDCGA